MVHHEPTPRRPEPGDPLESLLVDIWEQCLGQRPDDMLASFAAFGGTPELATRMIGQVEQTVATRLDPGRIALDITIEKLAASIRRQTAAAFSPGRARVRRPQPRRLRRSGAHLSLARAGQISAGDRGTLPVHEGTDLPRDAPQHVQHLRHGGSEKPKRTVIL